MSTTTPASNWTAYLRQKSHPTRTTVTGLCASFRELMPRSAPSTRREFITLLRTLERDFGARNAADFAPEWWIAWCDYRLHVGSAPKTIRKATTLARRVFAHGVQIGACAQNPFDHFPRGALPPNRPRNRMRSRIEVLSLEQIRRLLDNHAIPAERRLLWRLLLLTGIRIGEAAALSFGDWTPDISPLGELLIARSYDSKAHAIRATKTDLARYVPVHPELEQWLYDARARALFRLRREPSRFDLICPYDVPRSGGAQHPWYQAAALNWWHKDLIASGIVHPASGPRRLHAARHTFITRCLKAGANWRALERVTHNPNDERYEDHSAFGRYAHDLEWDDLCAAVGCLQVGLRTGGSTP